jgi:hypothetical protein
VDTATRSYWFALLEKVPSNRAGAKADHPVSPTTSIPGTVSQHLDKRSPEHHDVGMRTTITLDPDVARKLKELCRVRQSSFKETVNQILRRGLAAQELPARGLYFQVQPHAGGFKPGIDPAKLNQLADQLEAADFIAETRRMTEK